MGSGRAELPLGFGLLLEAVPAGEVIRSTGKAVFG
jgi:hypothetical protein